MIKKIGKKLLVYVNKMKNEEEKIYYEKLSKNLEEYKLYHAQSSIKKIKLD